ncbi:unnamed protein product [Arctogadus glacialis]
MNKRLQWTMKSVKSCPDFWKKLLVQPSVWQGSYLRASGHCFPNQLTRLQNSAHFLPTSLIHTPTTTHWIGLDRTKVRHMIQIKQVPTSLIHHPIATHRVGLDQMKVTHMIQITVFMT